MSNDTYTVDRSIPIDSPPAEIYPLVVDFRHWIEWSPWEGLDPELRRTCSGAASGSVVHWKMSGKKTLTTRVMGVFTSMDALVGPYLEKGLDQLKTLVEGSPR